MHYDVCRIMTFVALWRLLQFDVCCIMTFVTLWRLSHYDVCRIMTFVALLRLLLIVFVALLLLSHYYVCGIWGLAHYHICRQLWRLSLIGFVAVLNMFTVKVEESMLHCRRNNQDLSVICPFKILVNLKRMGSGDYSQIIQSICPFKTLELLPFLSVLFCRVIWKRRGRGIVR